jgi:hypothetical protein
MVDKDITDKFNPYEVIKELVLTDDEKELCRQRENVIINAEFGALIFEISYIISHKFYNSQGSYNELLLSIGLGAVMGGLLTKYHYWLGPKL